MRRSSGVLALLGFGGAVAGAAWIGSRYSRKNPETWVWYRGLKKPPFNPPDFVFPVVWTFLYACIAISGWRVWMQEDSPERTKALRLWVGQLISNAEWTRLFFGEHLPKWSLAEVVTLEAAVVRYILEARNVDKTAAALFVPYAAWV